MDLFSQIKKKTSRDVRLVILSDLAVFSSKQDGIWRDLGVKAYKHFQTLLLKFLSSEAFHNKDGNFFVGFQYFDSRDPEFKIGRKAGNAEFKAFTDKTLQTWKGIHEKSLKQRRKRKKESSGSKVKTFSSHAQALKRLCLEFSWVETDLFEEHEFEDDARNRQYVVIFSDLPKFDAKFKRNLDKDEAGALTRSLKTFEGAVDMVHKKKIQTFWWNINQNQVSPCEIRQINAILSKDSCGRVVPVEHLMYGTSSAPSHEKQNVINNGAQSPRAARQTAEPTQLWQGKLTIACRDWTSGTEDVSDIQLVCSGASVKLPKDVQIAPASDANCLLTFTSLMPNERLPSYVWLDHSLLLVTSTSESKGPKISNFEQVSVFLAEQGLCAIGYFEDTDGNFHHCMLMGVTANVMELRFCPIRDQFEPVSFKSMSTASFPRLKWFPSSVRLHLTTLPMKRKAIFLKKPMIEAQDSQLNAEAVRTTFNGNDLDHALILALTPLSEENYQLMAQIVRPAHRSEKGNSRDSHIREQGANYIQYRMEEGLGLCCGENESNRNESFEDADTTIISENSFDPKNEEDIFNTLKQLYRASVETEQPDCHQFAEYTRKAVQSLGEYQTDDPRKKMKKWLTKNLLISKKQMHKVFGKDDNHRLNECRLQVVIRLELVVSLIPEVVDPCKAKILNTMKNYLSDMAFIHDAKKVEAEFLRGLLKKYKFSLPKTLNEFYIHLDLDVPSEIKINPTPKRSPKKSQDQSPASQLKNVQKKLSQKIPPRRSPRLMKKKEREKSVSLVPTLRQPRTRKRRASSILPITVMTNTVPLNATKPKRAATPVYAFTRDLEFKAPPLTRKPSFTKRRSIRPRMKRKASDYIDDSDDEDGEGSAKKAPLPSKKKPAFVKPLPKKKTVDISTDAEKKRTASKISKKRKSSESVDSQELPPSVPILSFKRPPAKKRKTNDNSESRSKILESASKKRKRSRQSQKRTPTPPVEMAGVLSFQIPRAATSSDGQASPAKKRKSTPTNCESVSKKKKCTPVRKRPRRKKKRLKESPLFVPRQKRRKQLEKIRKLEGIKE